MQGENRVAGLVLVSPAARRKTLLTTVKKARRKRQVKGILGWVDSSRVSSDRSDTGSSAPCPVSLRADAA